MRTHHQPDYPLAPPPVVYQPAAEPRPNALAAGLGWLVGGFLGFLAAIGGLVLKLVVIFALIVVVLLWVGSKVEDGLSDLPDPTTETSAP